MGWLQAPFRIESLHALLEQATGRKVSTFFRRDRATIEFRFGEKDQNTAIENEIDDVWEKNRG